MGLLIMRNVAPDKTFIIYLFIQIFIFLYFYFLNFFQLLLFSVLSIYFLVYMFLSFFMYVVPKPIYNYRKFSVVKINQFFFIIIVV